MKSFQYVYTQFSTYFLQPFFESEDEQHYTREDEHEGNGERITEGPIELRHKLEVHTVHAGHEGRRQEDNVYHGEYLDDLVLLDVYETEEGILQVVQTIETELGVLEQRVYIFDNHREARLQFLGKEIALEDVTDDALFIHDVLSDDSHFFL